MSFRRLVVGALLLLAGCGTVEVDKPLPWFKIRSIHTPGLGGFGGGSTQKTVFVKRYGLWWTKIDCLGGEVLDRETVAVFCSGTFHSGTALLKKGETKPVAACGSYAHYGQILPDKGGVDCTEVLEGSAPIVPTKLRYWRIDLDRRVLFEHTLAIDEPGRSFQGPAARYYDDRNRPYFVAGAEDWRAAPDCELLTVEDGALVRVVAAPDLEIAECSEVGIWSQRSGRTLKTR